MPGFSVAKTVINVQIPEGMDVLMMPETAEKVLPAGAGSFKVSSVIEDNFITITFETDLKPACVEQADYQTLFNINTWLQHPDRKTIMLIDKQ